ncbi:MAG: FmdB family zinc ribbon protein [Actinomycetes bacterium]
MPMFEYACRGCGQHFEAFVTASRAASCPSCQGEDLQKLLSSPGMVGTSGRRETEAIPSCKSQGGHCACSHGPSLN